MEQFIKPYYSWSVPHTENLAVYYQGEVVSFKPCFNWSVPHTRLFFES